MVIILNSLSYLYYLFIAAILREIIYIICGLEISMLPRI